MSSNVSTETAREALRRDQSVRLVADHEEGLPADALPPGVYGFTASPILASPLFAIRRYRNFEVHRRADGVHLVGFVTGAAAAALSHPARDAVAVTIHPDAVADATSLVSIPYDRIAQHRQYAIRNADAIALQVLTAQPLGA